MARLPSTTAHLRVLQQSFSEQTVKGGLVVFTNFAGTSIAGTGGGYPGRALIQDALLLGQKRLHAEAGRLLPDGVGSLKARPRWAPSAPRPPNHPPVWAAITAHKQPLPTLGRQQLPVAPTRRQGSPAGKHHRHSRLQFSQGLLPWARCRRRAPQLAGGSVLPVPQPIPGLLGEQIIDQPALLQWHRCAPARISGALDPALPSRPS